MPHDDQFTYPVRQIKFRPTPKFAAFLAGGILLSLIGFIAPGFESAVLAYDLLLVIVAVASAWIARRGVKLGVHRRHQHLFSAHQENRVELTIRSEGSWPVVGQFSDEPPSWFLAHGETARFELAPDESKSWAYTVTPDARGNGLFSGTWVRVAAPLGLVHLDYQFANEAPVKSYPNVQAVREFDMLNRRGRLRQMGIRRSRMRGVGTEFESLRDYDNDDFRRIDWKATARRDRLTVRQFETERNQPVFIVVDCGHTMMADIDGASKLDIVLDSALMLTHAALESGDHVGFVGISDTVKQFIKPRRVKSQRGLITDALQSLDVQDVRTDYDAFVATFSAHWSRRSLIVLFTDVDDETEAKEMVAALSLLSRKHLVLLVQVADTRLAEVLHRDQHDMFLWAAGLWRKAGQSRTRLRLAEGRITVVEADASSLSRTLVNTYLKIKDDLAL